MLFAIHMLDRPGSAGLRTATGPAHREFVWRHLDARYLGGPLLADVTFIADEPYNRAGLFESVTIRAFGPVVEPS